MADAELLRLDYAPDGGDGARARRGAVQVACVRADGLGRRNRVPSSPGLGSGAARRGARRARCDDRVARLRPAEQPALPSCARARVVPRAAPRHDLARGSECPGADRSASGRHRIGRWPASSRLPTVRGSRPCTAPQSAAGRISSAGACSALPTHRIRGRGVPRSGSSLPLRRSPRHGVCWPARPPAPRRRRPPPAADRSRTGTGRTASLQSSRMIYCVIPP